MDKPTTLHAVCVAYDGKGVLIRGKSGSGKSTLALQLLAYGCDLVADDRVRLEDHDGTVMASAPAQIKGLIEARGIGILNAQAVERTKISFVVDLDQIALERLPQRRFVTVLGRSLPLIYRVDQPHFASAILQALKCGWSER